MNPLVRLLGTLSLCTLLCTAAQGQSIGLDRGITGFGLALRKLDTVGSVLYVTAHPDDENNGVLVRLSRGQGLRTGLLTLTRGDGGQNEIGPELFEAIGVLRSEELLAVHRYDGVEQYFSRAYEFGYSFSVEETFEKWGHEDTLRDVVRVIRTFRPHVMLSMNPGGRGGGQHHQTSARLTAEAFRAAADPARFPELTHEGLRPWKTSRLFQQSRFRRRPQVDAEQPPAYTVDIGEYDPLLGESFAELGMRARSRHRCQGMNVLPRPGSRASRYSLADSTVVSPEEATDFFTGIDHSLISLTAYDNSLAPILAELQQSVDRARSSYAASAYDEAVGQVMTGLALVRKALDSTTADEARHLLRQKEKDFTDAAAKGHFMQFEAFTRHTRDGMVVPGERFKVDVRYFSHGGAAIEDASLHLLVPTGWTTKRLESTESSQIFEVEVGEEADLSQPYWYRPDPRVDRYEIREGFNGYEPFPAPFVVARLEYSSGGVVSSLETPAEFRWFDAEAAQDSRMAVKVVPPLAVSVMPKVAVFQRRNLAAKKIQVAVRNNVPSVNRAELRLKLPTGWSSEPASREVEFRYENQEVTARFEVTPPASLPAGSLEIQAVASSGGSEFRKGYQTIAYPHIQTRHLYHRAVSRVEVIDLDIPGDLEVGYVMGVGDDVGIATEELGVPVTYLAEEDLARGDLSRYDVIVLGVRAYLNRQDLVANNQRLLDYVHAGGHLVVQYNKYEFSREQFTPFPMKINRPADRISVEESPVRLLVPAHPIFNAPNRISEDDWEGWVQERSTYMWGEWDENFTPLVEMEDPRPFNAGAKQGGLVLARYGEGTYLFVGLGFFRQLPAGVPGAYRLWSNAISLGRVLDPGE